jgi:hypothetical protein
MSLNENKIPKYFEVLSSIKQHCGQLYTGSILGECAWKLRESKGGIIRIQYMETLFNPDFVKNHVENPEALPKPTY